MEQTECSETLVYTIQAPGNYPEENIQQSEQGESLKSSSMLRNIHTESVGPDWYFSMTQATKEGHEIWYLEC